MFTEEMKKTLAEDAPLNRGLRQIGSCPFVGVDPNFLTEDAPLNRGLRRDAFFIQLRFVVIPLTEDAPLNRELRLKQSG